MRTRCRRFLCSSVLLVVVACGSPTAPVPGPTLSAHAQPSAGGVGAATPGGEYASPPPATTPAAPHGGFSVHEWGLVDVALDGTAEIAAGPGRPTGASIPSFGPAVRKPVLYVHLGIGVVDQRLSVTARIPAGAILEHWPSGDVVDNAVRWPSIVARSTPCSGTAFQARSQRDATPGCATPDGYCEIQDLPGYLTGDSACLDLGAVTAPFLFYRGQVQRVSLPLTFARDERHLQITSSEAPGAASSTVIWLAGGGAGQKMRVAAWPSAAARVLHLDAPTDGVRMDAVGDRLGADLLALGLTERERDVFLSVWLNDLLAVPGPAARSARVAPDPGNRILLWLSPSAAQRIAELSIEPAPAAIRRAMLLRVTFP